MDAYSRNIFKLVCQSFLLEAEETECFLFIEQILHDVIFAIWYDDAVQIGARNSKYISFRSFS